MRETPLNTITFARNGVQIHGGTILDNLLFPKEYLLQVVVLTNIDNEQLGNALASLGISPSNVGVNNQVKQAKFMMLLNSPGITIENIVQLHRANKKEQFSNMILVFACALSQSYSTVQPGMSQGVNSGMNQAIDLIAQNLQALNVHIQTYPTASHAP